MTLIEAEQYVDRLIAMRNMESRSYQCIGYLEYVNDNLENGETKSRTLDHHRQRISQWMYQLLDALKVDREIVYFSMNLLDRFLSNMTVEHNIDNYIGGSQYELASLTSLYIAIKINTNQHHPVHIERFEKLSRHKFTKHDISGMELVILTTLKWNVFPPSPAEYVGNYLSVLALQGSTKLCEKIMDISLFLTELAVCDYFFVTEQASIIAYASVLIAMEPFQDYFQDSFTVFLQILTSVGLFQESHDVLICIERLRELYSQNLPDNIYDEPGRISSPVSVAQI